MFMNLIRDAYKKKDWDLVDKACLQLFGESIYGKESAPLGKKPRKAKAEKKNEDEGEFYEPPVPASKIVIAEEAPQFMAIKSKNSVEVADEDAKIPCVSEPLNTRGGRTNAFNPTDYGVPSDKTPEIVKPPVARMRPKFEEVLARCVSCQSKSMVNPMFAKHYRCSACCKG